MDSMRSLNRSLPPASPKRQSVPLEDLLQSFKQAALSVTNLYKRAASEHVIVKRAGYQDAIYDLLSFLDKENLGLGDGEGWKVRRWATERQDRGAGAQGDSASEDEREAEKGSETPVPDERPEVAAGSSPQRPTSRPSSPLQTDHHTRAGLARVEEHASTLEHPEGFAFRSDHPYPGEIDMQPQETVDSQVVTSNGQTHKTVVQHRSSRGVQRHSHSTSKQTNRAAQTRSLGAGAGSKRKTTFGDFFDLSNLGDSKDGTSAHKRNRAA